jgi:hypothetical protein
MRARQFVAASEELRAPQMNEDIFTVNEKSFGTLTTTGK